MEKEAIDKILIIISLESVDGRSQPLFQEAESIALGWCVVLRYKPGAIRMCELCKHPSAYFFSNTMRNYHCRHHSRSGLIIITQTQNKKGGTRCCAWISRQTIALNKQRANFVHREHCCVSKSISHCDSPSAIRKRPSVANDSYHHTYTYLFCVIFFWQSRSS